MTKFGEVGMPFVCVDVDSGMIDTARIGAPGTCEKDQRDAFDLENRFGCAQVQTRVPKPDG